MPFWGPALNKLTTFLTKAATFCREMRSSTKELKHFKNLLLQQCSSVCWCLINVIMFRAKLSGIKVPWQARRGSIIHQPGAILHHSIHPVRLPNRTIMGKHLRSALSHRSAAEKQLDTQSPPSASAHLHDRGGPEQAHGPVSGVTGWTGNISQNPSQTAHWTALDHIRDSVTLCNLGIGKSSEKVTSGERQKPFRCGALLPAMRWEDSYLIFISLC